MELFQNILLLLLQTVSQSGIKMGNKAAKMLIDSLESEQEEEEEGKL